MSVLDVSPETEWTSNTWHSLTLRRLERQHEYQRSPFGGLRSVSTDPLFRSHHDSLTAHADHRASYNDWSHLGGSRVSYHVRVSPVRQISSLSSPKCDQLLQRMTGTPLGICLIIATSCNLISQPGVFDAECSFCPSQFYLAQLTMWLAVRTACVASLALSFLPAALVRASFADPPPPPVLSPKSGDVWTVGEVMTVRWCVRL